MGNDSGVYVHVRKRGFELDESCECEGVAAVEDRSADVEGCVESEPSGLFFCFFIPFPIPSY